ncbi:MAG: isoprenoid biosynthesis glyoxalase ElbB [Desulfobacterales bacterium]|nr:isoprenoid biosynthesis glyoxalase ElbB [Desulfobacterales bacterium]
MTKKIGVLLSGCGNKDGSEIHESVLTLLALDLKGAQAICMAPDIEQYDVVNHLTGKPVKEKRNVLVESARIARGNIKNIKDISSKNIDALIIPGGIGAIKNLSNFTSKGKDAVVHEDVNRLIKTLSSEGKPIGAICIAPATLAKALANKSPEVTIGTDPGTSSIIEAMGAHHVSCSVEMIHIDQNNKLITTPAYMLGPGIKDIWKGIEKLVNAVVELA